MSEFEGFLLLRFLPSLTCRRESREYTHNLFIIVKKSNRCVGGAIITGLIKGVKVMPESPN